jgi:SAM-dependent methyltransferase
VTRASRDAPPSVGFVVHDATVLPFPTGPPDVVYARLLLAHLRDPAAIVVEWTSALAPGGVAFLDDLEDIHTAHPAFRAYLDEVAFPVVRREGGRLLVGPALHMMNDPAGTERIHDEVSSFTPPPSVTARIFGMNLAVLVERGEIDPRPDLAEELAAIEGGRAVAEPVEWSMRQVALRRIGSASR